MTTRKKYQKATIKALIGYLADYQLEVIGPHMVDNVELNGGLMNYGIDEIMTRIKAIDTDTLETEDE